jgi:hypothetical protein
VFADAGSEGVSLLLWRQLLQDGGSAAPLGVGDVHSTAEAAAVRPMAHVYARSRTPDSILEALRQRRVVATRGPRLDFWLESATDGRVALLGDRVNAGEWRAHAPDSAAVIELPLTNGGRCLYAELREPDGRLQAVSAPIWIDTSS